MKSPRSITLEDSEAFVSSIREEGEREALKNARKKLEILMEAEMPCKTVNKEVLKEAAGILSESDESSKNPKRQSMHASWKLMNPRESVWNPLSKDHEDHIAGKGYNSISHQKLVHKFLPMRQAMKIPSAKVEQGMEEVRNDTSLAIGQDEE